MMMSNDDKELIDVPQIGDVDQTDTNHIPRSLLIGIIQPRVEEIFEMIRDQIEEFSGQYQIGKRVVLTGGASQLPNIRDLAQIVLDKQVRMGRPLHQNVKYSNSNTRGTKIVSQNYCSWRRRRRRKCR